MKIAFFHNLPSGGALRALYEKIKLFESKGWHVSLYMLSTAEKDFLPLPLISGELFEAQLSFSGISKWQRYRKASRLCADKINASGVDLVYVDKCRFLSAPTILRLLKKPTIFYLHEPLGIWEYSAKAIENQHATSSLSRAFQKLSFFSKLKKIFSLPERLWIKFEDKRNVLSAKRVLTCSQFAQRWIERVYGIKAEVAYQGVDANFFTAKNESVKKNQVLSVGRIESRKGHDFLIEVLAHIETKLRPVLVIACDAELESYKENLKRQASNRGVKIDIIYRPTQLELRNVYRQSLAVLCAGINEPFGLAPLEAGGCATAVIAIDAGGYRETVLHTQTGYLLPRDPAVWAKHITSLMHDRALAERLGDCGRIFVEREWTWQKFWDTVVKV